MHAGSLKMSKEKLVKFTVGLILPFILYSLAAKISGLDFVNFMSVAALILIGSNIQKIYEEG